MEALRLSDVQAGRITGLVLQQLVCFVYLLGLATSQRRFPVAVAVEVDHSLLRAEKKIYFVA